MHNSINQEKRTLKLKLKHENASDEEKSIKLHIPLGIDNMSETILKSVLEYVDALKEEISLKVDCDSSIENEVLLLTLKSLNHAIEEVVKCK